MNNKNPYSICTWDEQSECDKCEINGMLICKSDKQFRKKFISFHLTFRITVFLGLALVSTMTKNWWIFFVYALGVILNFGILEPRLLCSHCPFYAEKSKFLHCNTLYGLPKLWKYRPEPINKTEKVLQLICGGFVDLYPVVLFLYGIFIAFKTNATPSECLAIISMTVILILLMYILNGIIQGEVCTKCPNFSCVMNKVPKVKRDAYIEQNPIIKSAWEKSGYDISK